MRGRAHVGGGAAADDARRVGEEAGGGEVDDGGLVAAGLQGGERGARQHDEQVEGHPQADALGVEVGARGVAGQADVGARLRAEEAVGQVVPAGLVGRGEGAGDEAGQVGPRGRVRGVGGDDGEHRFGEHAHRDGDEGVGRHGEGEGGVAGALDDAGGDDGAVVALRGACDDGDFAEEVAVAAFLVLLVVWEGAEFGAVVCAVFG